MGLLSIFGRNPTVQSAAQRTACGAVDGTACKALDAVAKAADHVPPRTYLFHGVDTKQLADHGRASMEKMAQYFRDNGIPEAKALAYNSDNFLVNQFAIPREQLFGTFSDRMTDEIVKDLDAHPLAEGQKVSLVGYSLGTKVASNVAENLEKRNIPVETLALIEVQNGNTPPALKVLPRVQRALLVENQDIVQLQNPYKDVFIRRSEPTQTHFSMVENPTPGMLRFLTDNIK